MIAELHGFAQATTKTLERLSEPKVHNVTLMLVPFKSRTKDHDMVGWPEWSSLFKCFMGILDKEKDSDLDLLEKDLTQVLGQEAEKALQVLGVLPEG